MVLIKGHKRGAGKSQNNTHVPSRWCTSARPIWDESPFTFGRTLNERLRRYLVPDLNVDTTPSSKRKIKCVSTDHPVTPETCSDLNMYVVLGTLIPLLRLLQQKKDPGRMMEV